MALIVTRDMGVDHQEFLRILPQVLGFSPALDNGMIAVEHGKRRLTIRLAPQIVRRLGLLALPVTLVELEFSGYGPDEAHAFMGRFDRAYQRGGG